MLKTRVKKMSKPESIYIHVAAAGSVGKTSDELWGGSPLGWLTGTSTAGFFFTSSPEDGGRGSRTVGVSTKFFNICVVNFGKLYAFFTRLVTPHVDTGHLTGLRRNNVEEHLLLVLGPHM